MDRVTNPSALPTADLAILHESALQHEAREVTEQGARRTPGSNRKRPGSYENFAMDRAYFLFPTPPLASHDLFYVQPGKWDLYSLRGTRGE